MPSCRIATLLMLPACLVARPLAAQVPATPQARADEPQNCELIENEFVYIRVLGDGTSNSYVSGPMEVRCDEGVRIRADSAVIFEASGYSQLFDNVMFEDAIKQLTSDRATYFGRDRRLIALGNGRIVDKVQSSVITGDTVVYARANDFRPQDVLNVRGGAPHATLFPPLREPDPPADTAPGDSASIDPAEAIDAPPEGEGEGPGAEAEGGQAPEPSRPGGRTDPARRGEAADAQAPARDPVAVADSVAPPVTESTTAASADSTAASDDSTAGVADAAAASTDSTAGVADAAAASADSTAGVADPAAASTDSTAGVADSAAASPDSAAALADSALALGDSASADSTAGPEVDVQADGSAPSRASTRERPRYEVDATSFSITADRYFRAQGDVVIEKDSLEAYGDSLLYDQQIGDIILMGSARIDEDAFELTGDSILLGDDTGPTQQIRAVGNAALVGRDVDLTAPQIRIELSDGRLERLLALVAPTAEPAAGVSPGAAPAGDTVEAAPRPRAIAQDFVLVGDSIEVRAPGEVLEQVLAMGDARGESVARDSLNTEDTPEVARRDWLEGDVVTVFFSPRLGPDGETLTTADGSGRARVELDRVVAQGTARSLYRMTPSDTTTEAAPGRLALHYVTGSEITIRLIEGEVESMEVEGQARGYHLEPLVEPSFPTSQADSVGAPTDTTSARPDTAGAARRDTARAVPPDTTGAAAGVAHPVTELKRPPRVVRDRHRDPGSDHAMSRTDGWLRERDRRGQGMDPT